MFFEFWKRRLNCWKLRSVHAPDDLWIDEVDVIMELNTNIIQGAEVDG